MKFITVFFDLEDWWELPYKFKFDLTKIVGRVLNVLNKHQIKAVFNIAGITIEHFPKLVEKLNSEGYEISPHGYEHENFVELEKTGELDGILDKIEELFLKTIGTRPIGTRFPWVYYNDSLYSAIAKRGYRWASNKRIVHVEEFELVKSYPRIPVELFFKILWMFYRKEPFKVNGILEIPLLSSFDGALLAVSPIQKSSSFKLKYTFEVLKSQFDKSNNYFNLNFHPWCIATGNRLTLLEKILNYISKQDSSFILPREMI